MHAPIKGDNTYGFGVRPETEATVGNTYGKGIEMSDSHDRKRVYTIAAIIITLAVLAIATGVAGHSLLGKNSVALLPGSELAHYWKAGLCIGISTGLSMTTAYALVKALKDRTQIVKSDAAFKDFWQKTAKYALGLSLWIGAFGTGGIMVMTLSVGVLGGFACRGRCKKEDAAMLPSS